MSNLEDIKLLIGNLEKLVIEKFDALEKKIDLINESSTKMNSHINFVEETYNTLQMPLNYLKKSVERLTGSSSKDLPIKDKNSD